MDKKKKKLLLIILISVVTVLLVAIVVILLVKKSGTKDDDSGTNVSSTKNTPTYELVDSDTVFPLIVAAAKEWASDAQFLNCSGTVIQYKDGSATLYYGGEDGKQPSWSCFIYSKSLKQDTTVRWSKGVATVNSASYTWGQSEYEANPDERDFFDPVDFVNTKDVYELLISSGLNIESSYITYNFGLSEVLGAYGDDVIWQVNEYSRDTFEDPTDEYSQGLRVKVHYVDGVSGGLMKSENL